MIFINFYRKQRKKETHPNRFNEASITPLPKSDKQKTNKKKNHRQTLIP